MQQVVISLVVIQHTACLSLYCDASLTLNVQFIQNLLVPARFDCACEFQQAVAKRALAMIDVCDYAEVAETLGWNGSNAFLEVRLCLWWLSGEVHGRSMEDPTGDRGQWLAKSIAN